jgi:hypothetical protein
MKKLFIALSIGLAGCTSGVPIFSTPPAPLAATSIDEKGLIVALQTFDTLLTSIDRLIAAKVIVPGSPRAIQIADAIRSAKLAYQAASAAQRVGSSGSYEAAIAQAQVAIARINVLVKGN